VKKPNKYRKQKEEHREKGNDSPQTKETPGKCNQKRNKQGKQNDVGIENNIKQRDTKIK
jgi:hypothetical protein